MPLPGIKEGSRKAGDLTGGNWNLPNALTVIRILIAPLIVLLLVKESRRRNRLAAAALGMAALTDFLDGYLARRQGKETRLGQFLDPLADKICISSVFVMLAKRGRLASWVPGVIIGREALITLFRVYAGARGGSVPASIWGKLKTNSQLLALLAVIMEGEGRGSGTLRDTAVAAAVALTLYSGLDYMVKARRYLPPAEGG
ncbi:MAG: CDP-diacylglycerol--glycerol-3-phosphate 3-phosphatidyltransferase [Actinomycetota bacterium]